MSNLKEVKEILNKYDIYPKKSLGQNFLIDQNIIDKIIKVSQVKKEDHVLEIGPGLGLITRELDKISASVLAIEKDRVFFKILNDFNFKHTKVVEADILEYILCNNISKYKVVSNIPYYLTTNLIRNLLETKNQPKEIYLVVQKEVGERIVKGGNLLSISIKYYAEPKICFYISKNSFWPKPKVESALMRILPFKKYEEKDKLFFKFLKAGFSAPRKKLINNLAFKLREDKEKLELGFNKAKISKDVRAERLSVLNWKNLFDSIYF
ncbi:MAG: 16S rRNA (adenine(1518)-N(6)/adenine(1519)-N(6))-dimethyltransferase RsmA [Candidatus Paceibacterota bacterium]